LLVILWLKAVLTPKATQMRHGNGDGAEETGQRSSELGSEEPRGRDLTTPNSDGLASAAVAAADGEEEVVSKERSKPVAWRDLPRRDQLLILTLARLSEPLVQTSLQVRDRLRFR
jgi:hypothetical protein